MAYSSRMVEIDPFEFRETPAIELWSARIPFDVEVEEFQYTAAVFAFETGQRFTGFIEQDESQLYFARTRYPRLKYGVSTIAECEEGVALMAERLGEMVHPEPQTAGVRVVLGLLEGYEQGSRVHEVEEVVERLSTAHVEQGEVFSVRPQETGVFVYTEPVAIVRADVSAIPNIYGLADEFGQERFTIENFDTRRAYVVETRHCTEPDSLR